MPTITNDEILSAIESKTLLEVAELVKMMEEKFGVSSAAPMAAPVAAAAAAPTEEKTEFDVVLTSAGEKKIQVLKVVR